MHSGSASECRQVSDASGGLRVQIATLQTENACYQRAIDELGTIAWAHQMDVERTAAAPANQQSSLEARLDEADVKANEARADAARLRKLVKTLKTEVADVQAANERYADHLKSALVDSGELRQTNEQAEQRRRQLTTDLDTSKKAEAEYADALRLSDEQLMRATKKVDELKAAAPSERDQLNEQLKQATSKCMLLQNLANESQFEVTNVKNSMAARRSKEDELRQTIEQKKKRIDELESKYDGLFRFHKSMIEYADLLRVGEEVPADLVKTADDCIEKFYRHRSAANRPAACAAADRRKTVDTPLPTIPTAALGKNAEVVQQGLAGIAKEAQKVETWRAPLAAPVACQSSSSGGAQSKSARRSPSLANTEVAALKRRVDELQRLLDERNVEVAALRRVEARYKPELDILRMDVVTNLKPQMCRLQRDTLADLDALGQHTEALASRAGGDSQRCAHFERRLAETILDRDRIKASFERMRDVQQPRLKGLRDQVDGILQVREGDRAENARLVGELQYSESKVLQLEAEIGRLNSRDRSTASPDTTEQQRDSPPDARRLAGVDRPALATPVSVELQTELSIAPAVVKQEWVAERDALITRSSRYAHRAARSDVARSQLQAVQPHSDVVAAHLPADFDALLLDCDERGQREATLNQALSRARAEIGRLRRVVMAAKERDRVARALTSAGFASELSLPTTSN